MFYCESDLIHLSAVILPLASPCKCPQLLLPVLQTQLQATGMPSRQLALTLPPPLGPMAPSGLRPLLASMLRPHPLLRASATSMQRLQLR